MRCDFELQDLLELIGQEAHTEGFLSPQEWAEKLDISRTTFRRLLHAAKKAGVLRTGREFRMFIDDRKGVVPVYAFDLKEKPREGGHDRCIKGSS